MRQRLPLTRFVDPARPITYGIVQAGEDHPNGVPYIRPVDMDGQNGVPDPSLLRRTAPEIALLYKRSEVRPGDLVVSIGPSFGKVMIVPNELDGANLTQGTARLAPAPDVDPRFLYWSLQSKATLAYWESVVSGATFSALNLEPLGRTPITSLDHPTQRRVAAFLDAETARIDVLVEKKSRLVELLRGRTAAALDSDIARLREIHPMIRVKYLMDEIDERLGDETAPELLSVSIHQGVVTRSSMTDKLPRAEELTAYKRCRPGDIAVNRMRAFQGGLGRVPVDGIVSPDYTVLRAHGGVDSGFLHHLFRSTWFVGEMTARLRGIGNVDQGNVRTPRINFAELGGIRIPTPPLDEQKSLAAEFDAGTAQTGALVGALHRQISLLQERRQALITAAVTGDLDLVGAP